MASQPPQRFVSQQSSQYPASPSTPSEATPSEQRRRSSIPQSTTSEDSQPVFLNHPSSSESSPRSETQEKQLPQRPKPQSVPSTKEPRKCWICFGDETEDSPTSSQWRSPCPCALTAHEACLLDWVADLEAPAKRRRSSPKIECPQCKSRITIARPRSPIVELVRAIEHVTGKLLVPTVLITLAGTVVTGCWMHGISTVFVMFGPEDAERLLTIDNGLRINNNWGLSLPFIPMALIASRTTYADTILPVIPIFYFASSAPRRDGSLWPPSAAFTVATLPYIRAVYNEFYTRVLAPREKAWAKAIQPRAGENEEGEAQDDNHVDGDNDIPGGVNFELDLQVELVEEEEVNEDQPHQPEAPAVNVPADAQGEGEPGQDQNQEPNQPPQPQNHNHPQPAPANQGGLAAGALVINFIAASQMIIGALLFPTVSASMGVLLKVALPKTWTIPPSRWDRYPVGFLQSRFGRSVAGGCLFVALKDTFLLYSKYRLAQDHKKRRVLDYAAKKNTKTSSRES